MRIAAVIAALFVGVALTAAVAWNAAEAHYTSCLEAAQALPDRRDSTERRIALLHGEDTYAEAVYKRVQGCSRLP